eukprot:m.356545 g.356545  ORF g.356545 m.356545 type:complete len:909 (-) comp17570_c0_seq1:280-3006(-)
MSRREEIRGLYKFIKDIRAAGSPDDELKRINKELANIRQKFGEKKGLNGYQKKKYVCKLIFMFLLGHEIEFGYMEAINLMSSLQYSEKQIGYLFASVMLNEHHELMRMVIQAIKTDLSSRHELHVCLALHCISNIGGKDTAAEVSTIVQRLLVADESPNTVKKKAALSMLRLYREAPDQVSIREYSPRVIQLLTSPDNGVVTSVASLITSLAVDMPEQYAPCVPLVATKLHRIVFAGGEASDYIYYRVPAPWLTVKLLRLLQLFPYPADDAEAARVNSTLDRLLSRIKESPGVDAAGRPVRPRINYYNVLHACMFEAINLIAHYDNSAPLQIKACGILGDFLIHKEVNMRFLALESLTVMGLTEFSHDAVKRYQGEVIKAIKRERDPTVQRRAVDVLYTLCDSESVESIVNELLTFLDRADYSIREELVLKVAVLAERFVTTYSWYVDVMLRLIKLAGDHVSSEVWYRVIQVVVGQESVQDYAAKTCYEALLDPSAHEAMVNVGSYVLGEYGHLIANDPNSTPQKQLEILQMHYPMVSAQTRASMLSTYVKLANLFPEIKMTILEVLKADSFTRNSDTELQQRANEYIALLRVQNTDVLPAVLEEMPAFTEEQTRLLGNLEAKKSAAVTDGDVGTFAARKRQAGKKIELSAVDGVAHQKAQAAAPTIVTNDAFFDKFTLVNDGLLYENPVLQIGVKSEFKMNLGRLTVFYGNRSNSPMTDVSVKVINAQPEACKIDAHSIDTKIDPSVQLKQQISAECISCFSEPPVLEVRLKYQDRPVEMHLKLPVLLNKFLMPLSAPMTDTVFFQKWNQLGGPPREVKQTIKATKTRVATDLLEQTMIKFGLPAMPGIDKKPQNVVSAAILHTSTAQIGCLLRAEPNPEAQMYRFTLRTSSDAVSAVLSNLLVGNF